MTSQTVAHQAPLSMAFSRHEYWSGLSCPPPGHLPNPGIEPRSPTLLADSLLSEPPVQAELGQKSKCKLEQRKEGRTIPKMTGEVDQNPVINMPLCALGDTVDFESKYKLEQGKI